MKKEANDLFAHKNYNRALAKYGKAFRIAENALLYSQDDEAQMNEFCVSMFLNVSICSLKLGKYKYTISMCKKVLSIEPNHLKATFLIGKVYRLQSKFNKAKEFLLRAKQMSPLNGDVCKELTLLSKDIQSYNDSMEKMCKAMFNNKDEEESKENQQNGDDASTKHEDLVFNLKEINQSLLETFELRIKDYVNNTRKDSIKLSNVYVGSEVELIRKICKDHDLLCEVESNCITVSKRHE
ncbi:Peptidyl-prolyl cis-trans isomerase D [Thelohanellus kitauei]|uniref:Peptidyl-prolyl cis-trans isomerase D n=1 Tax=Thelohanellus kitauei TaxID=669202 RepID=A0A0C2J166_THEKT|nr:Peptidyl-prolyl cis-trans isomerase D [Thelohanellus kitauei]